MNWICDTDHMLSSMYFIKGLRDLPQGKPWTGTLIFDIVESNLYLELKQANEPLGWENAHQVESFFPFPEFGIFPMLSLAVEEDDWWPPYIT